MEINVVDRRSSGKPFDFPLALGIGRIVADHYLGFNSNSVLCELTVINPATWRITTSTCPEVILAIEITDNLGAIKL